MPDVSKSVGVSFKITGLDKNADFSKLATNLEAAKSKVEALQQALNGIKINTDIKGVADSLSALSKIKVPNLKQIADGFKALEKMKTPPSLEKFANEIKKFESIKLPNVQGIANAFKTLADTTLSTKTATDNIKTLGESLNQFKGIKVPNLNNIVKGLEAFKNVSLGDLPNRIKELANALNILKGIKLPNIQGMVNGLKAFLNLDITGLAQKIKDLSAQLKILSQQGYMKNFSAFAADLNNLNSNLNKVVGTITKANATMNQFTTAANNAGRGVRTLGDKIMTIATFRLIADGINLIKSSITGLVSSIGTYDQAIKDMQAITRASSDEVDMMRKRILEISSDSKFSAIEIAQGLKVIGQAGFTATESLEIVDDAAVLARGTLSDMSTVIDLMTTTLRVFRLGAEDSTHIINVFANAINGSKLDVEKLNTAVSYIGPIANAAGVSLEEMTASMMILADAGLRASKIGTGLRRVFSEMVAPTKNLRGAMAEAGIALADIDPTTVSLATALKNLKTVINDSGDAFTLFGKRGALAAIELTSNIDRFENLTKSITESGSAARMAAIQMEGLVDQWTKLKGKVQNLGIAIGNSGLAEVLRVLLKTLNAVVDGIAAFLDTGLGKFLTFVVGAVAAIGLLVGAFLLLKGAIVFVGAKLALLLAPALQVLTKLGSLRILLARLISGFTLFGLTMENTFGDVMVAIQTFGSYFSKQVQSWVAQIKLWILKFAPLIYVWNDFNYACDLALAKTLRAFARFVNQAIAYAKNIPLIGTFAGWVADISGVESAFNKMEKSTDSWIASLEAGRAQNAKTYGEERDQLEKVAVELRKQAYLAGEKLPVERQYLLIQNEVIKAQKEILRITEQVQDAHKKEKDELKKAYENAAAKAEEFKGAFTGSVEDAEKALDAFTKNIEGSFDNIWATFVDTKDVTAYEEKLKEMGDKNKKFTTEMELLANDITLKLAKARSEGLGKAFEATLGQYDAVLSKFDSLISAQRTKQQDNAIKALNNEKELRDKTIIFTNDILKKKVESAQKFTKELDKSLKAALKLEQNYKQALAETLKSLTNNEKDRDEIIRSLRQEEMSAEQKFYDQKKQFYDKLSNITKLQKTDAKDALTQIDALIQEAQNFKDIDGGTTTAQKLVNELFDKRKGILEDVAAVQKKEADAAHEAAVEIQKQMDSMIEKTQELQGLLEKGLVAEMEIRGSAIDEQINKVMEDKKAYVEAVIQTNTIGKQIEALNEQIQKEVKEKVEAANIEVNLNLKVNEMVNQVEGLKDKVKGEIDIQMNSKDGSVDAMHTKLGEILGIRTKLEEEPAPTKLVSYTDDPMVQAAIDDINALIQKRMELPELNDLEPLEIKVKTEGLSEADLALKGIEGDLSLITKQTNTPLEVKMDTKAAVKEVQALLDKAWDLKTEFSMLEVKKENIPLFNTIENLLDELYKAKEQLEKPIKIAESEEAHAKIVALKEDLQNLAKTPYSAKTEVETHQAKMSVEDLIKKIAELKDKTITITTKYVTQGQEPTKRRWGGKLGPGWGGGDRIPVLAEAGEWYINKEASRHYGDAFMSAINNMQLPRFRTGGKVAQQVMGVQKFATGGKVNSFSLSDLQDFGRVELTNGTTSFPGMVHRSVADELKLTLRKERLMGAR